MKILQIDRDEQNCSIRKQEAFPQLANIEETYMNKSVSINAVDLFAGAGGLSLAANNVGINVLAAVENAKYACQTYRHNLIDRLKVPARLFEADINELSPEAIIAEIPTFKKGCDLLIGGPPCQGFSTHRIKNQGVGDPRNELLIRYFYFVKKFQPTVFLVENVPGLLWPRHKDYLKRFKEEAVLAGYRINDPVVLNARDYGVPQSRKRVFILGIKSSVDLDICWPPATTHCDPVCNSKQGNGKYTWIPALNVFRKSISEDDPNNVHMNHSQALVKRFQNTPANGGSRSQSGFTLPCHKEHDGHKDCYGRIDPSKPGPTMTTACINPSKGRFVHPTEHHGITLRHAARFQTFPDDFIFMGGLIAGGVQIGNAVPVIMGERLLGQIARSLKKYKAETDD